MFHTKSLEKHFYRFNLQIPDLNYETEDFPATVNQTAPFYRY